MYRESTNCVEIVIVGGEVFMEDLLKRKSFLRILFDTIPILILVLDPDLRVHAVNEAAKKFLGSGVEKLLLNR